LYVQAGYFTPGTISNLLVVGGELPLAGGGTLRECDFDRGKTRRRMTALGSKPFTFGSTVVLPRAKPECSEPGTSG
jgi:hypothetical protein